MFAHKFAFSKDFINFPTQIFPRVDNVSRFIVAVLGVGVMFGQNFKDPWGGSSYWGGAFIFALFAYFVFALYVCPIFLPYIFPLYVCPVCLSNLFA